MTPQVIGIVGGLGPFAHLELEGLLLAETRARLGAKLDDQDYPEWIVSSIPATPDRTLALLGRGPSPVPAMRRSLGRLAAAGADFAVIACNTAHAFLDELRATAKVPIVDMIEVTLERAREELGAEGRLGLLATTGTCRSRVYHDRLAPGQELLTLFDLPEGAALQESLVMTPIYGPRVGGRRCGGGIKSGAVGETVDAPLRRAATLLREAGAELLILGCTELPLSLGRDPIDGMPLLDPMQALARRALDLALGDASPSPGPRGALAEPTR